MGTWNHNYYVYILTNKYNSVLYTGVTGNLVLRTTQHKEGKYDFTARYKVTKLVYYEWFDSIDNAISREKQIKSGSRKRKEELITSMNPEWNDLFEKL